jgi:hypothetical protein
MGKVDRLFLMWNCPECVVVKERIKKDSIFSDEYRTTDGRQVFVYYTFSNTACRDLLDKYGLVGKFTPVMVTDEGVILETVNEILSYCGRIGMM